MEPIKMFYGNQIIGKMYQINSEDALEQQWRCLTEELKNASRQLISQAHFASIVQITLADACFRQTYRIQLWQMVPFYDHPTERQE